MNPEPEKAIEEAQKAIETLATDMGLTKLTTSVYTGLLGDIKVNEDKYLNIANDAYKIHDALNKAENKLNERYALWFAEMLDLIQKTHPARHKSQVVKDFRLNPESAQQAVMMATLACWIIKNKYIYKKPNKKIKE